MVKRPAPPITPGQRARARAVLPDRDKAEARVIQAARAVAANGRPLIESAAAAELRAALRALDDCIRIAADPGLQRNKPRPRSVPD
jgi:hypothetical protein